MLTTFPHLSTPCHPGQWFSAQSVLSFFAQHRPAEPQNSLQDPRVSLSRDPEMGEGNPRYTREECREQSPAPDLGPGSLRAGPDLAPAAILDRCSGADDKLSPRGLLGYVRPNPVGKRSETILSPAAHPGSFLEPGHGPRSRASTRAWHPGPDA